MLNYYEYKFDLNSTNSNNFSEIRLCPLEVTYRDNELEKLSNLPGSPEPSPIESKSAELK